MRIGSLFSGIGGLELGLERAGVGHVVWQCEVDEFCRSILAKHWPNVTRFDDVTRPRDYPHVDLICGGFPCQDVSSAGARRGLGGQKSSLWWHFADVVRRVRPRFVVVENVASGKRLWLPHVRHQLHLLGYGTSAYGISAADVGAPHLRRRVFVVADARGEHLRQQSGRRGRSRREGASLAARAGQDGAPADDAGLASGVSPGSEGRTGLPGACGDGDGDGESVVPVDGQVAGVPGVASGASAWASPPVFRGVDDGLPRRLDAARNRALGNAVVPQCAEAIGRVILQMMSDKRRPTQDKEK